MELGGIVSTDRIGGSYRIGGLYRIGWWIISTDRREEENNDREAEEDRASTVNAVERLGFNAVGGSC